MRVSKQRSWEARELSSRGRGRLGAREWIIPHDGGAEQQHGGILLAEAIQILQVDVWCSIHVEIVGRQVTEAEVEVEVDVAGSIDEGADGCDEQMKGDSPTLEKCQGHQKQKGEDENRNKRRP